MATDINDQGIAGGAGVVSIDTGPPAAGTPYFTFKQFSIVVDGAATETAHNYVELPSVDMTNLVEVSAGQFYFMVRSGTSWLLCQYNAGDSFYTTLATYVAEAVPLFPTGWVDFTITGNDQIDQSLYRKSDGTLLWMRHGTYEYWGGTRDRVCAIEVTVPRLTMLPDVLDLGGYSLGFQTWGTYSDSPEIIVGEVGDDRGYGGGVQGLRWWVDDFAISGAPLAGYPMLRRWFVENPGSDLLIAGHFGPYVDSPNGGLAVVVPEIAGTEVTDWGAAGGRGDVMLLAGGNGIAFEGEAGGSGEVNIVGTTTEVSFDGEAGGLGDVTISPRCELTFEGTAGGRGTATVGDGTVLAFDGMAGGIGDITFPSWYPGVQGYSGAELALHTPTYASPALWTWGASRPAGYDTRANRAFGARMRSSGLSRPSYDRSPDGTNELYDHVGFWCWMSQCPSGYETTATYHPFSFEPDPTIPLYDVSSYRLDGQVMFNTDYPKIWVYSDIEEYRQFYTNYEWDGILWISDDGTKAVTKLAETTWANIVLSPSDDIDSPVAHVAYGYAPWDLPSGWVSDVPGTDAPVITKAVTYDPFANDGVTIAKHLFIPVEQGITYDYTSGIVLSNFHVDTTSPVTIVVDCSPTEELGAMPWVVWSQLMVPKIYGYGSTYSNLVFHVLWSVVDGVDTPEIRFGKDTSTPYVTFSSAELTSIFTELPLGPYRFIVTIDSDGMMAVYVNGTMIGAAQDCQRSSWQAFTETFYELPMLAFGGWRPINSFTWQSLSSSAFQGTLYETGFLRDYAATADDVATNPALARRYGLAATPPPWET